jgi:hypothetical protein
MLAGCGPALPPLNFSVPNVGPSTSKLDGDLRSVTVSLARPDEQTGVVESWVYQQTGLWKEALIEAINRAAIFNDNSPRKVSLVVKIQEFDWPNGGLTMTSKTAARYELIDRANGSIIYTTDIHGDAEIPVSYAFLGSVRSVEAINRSVQNNIALFLQSLEGQDLSRPMFPNQQRNGR